MKGRKCDCEKRTNADITFRRMVFTSNSVGIKATCNLCGGLVGWYSPEIYELSFGEKFNESQHAA